jgi:hypothetical protein
MSFLAELCALRRRRELVEQWHSVGSVVYSQAEKVCVTKDAQTAALLIALQRTWLELANRLIEALRKLQDRDLISALTENNDHEPTTD